MKNTSNKDKVNSLLKELFALVKKEKFTDIKLKDGSILRTPDDTLIKGSKITLVSPEGAETDAPDGDSTSADGSIITVKSGVVDNIAAAPIEDTAAVPANKEKAIPAQETKMDAPAVSAPAPVANPDAAGDAASDDDEVGGMDMVGLITLIKNLVERVSALEGNTASSAMATEKMSASEPAAKPFNFSPFKEGTIGAELNKYKVDHKSNLDRIEKQLLELSKKKMAPVVLNNAANQNFSKVNVNPANKPKINLGGSFSVEGGK